MVRTFGIETLARLVACRRGAGNSKLTRGVLPLSSLTIRKGMADGEECGTRQGDQGEGQNQGESQGLQAVA